MAIAGHGFRAARGGANDLWRDVEGGDRDRPSGKVGGIGRVGITILIACRRRVFAVCGIERDRGTLPYLSELEFHPLAMKPYLHTYYGPESAS